MFRQFECEDCKFKTDDLEIAVEHERDTEYPHHNVVLKEY